ncbi:MAG: DUF5320 domain-containing protein [Pseudothermotoga sp.]
MWYSPGWYGRRPGFGRMGIWCPWHFLRHRWWYSNRAATREEEKQYFESVKKELEDQLQEINKRLDELK